MLTDEPTAARGETEKGGLLSVDYTILLQATTKSSSMGADKLLVRPTPHPQHADCRLLCFPWAGGGAAYFIGWVKKFLPGVEVVAVRLPGRECRFKEPCYTSLEEAVREITDAVGQTLNDKPIATFGHSLGALLSFAVAEKLQEQYSTSPVHMFVSGMSAPHSAQVQEKDKVSSRTDEEFMAYVKSLGGTPNEVLQNEELMALVLPMLRADYSVYEQFFYKLPSTKPLSCPIHVFDGIDDRKHDLGGWRDLTSGDTQITMLPGGHFYLKEAANQVKLTAQISECLHDVVRLTDQPV